MFGESAIEEALRLGDGEPISVAGDSDAELYSRPDGAPRITWKITVDSVLSAHRKPKAKSEQTNRQPRAAGGRGAASASRAAPTLGALMQATTSPSRSARHRRKLSRPRWTTGASTRCELADLAASYWISVREAAARSERLTLETHGRQVAAVTREAFATVKTLGSQEATEWRPTAAAIAWRAERDRQERARGEPRLSILNTAPPPQSEDRYNRAQAPCAPVEDARQKRKRASSPSCP